MRKNELQEMKKMELVKLQERAFHLQKEIASLYLDKAQGKLANLKTIRGKRLDLAQVLTVQKQKTDLKKLEGKNG